MLLPPLVLAQEIMLTGPLSGARAKDDPPPEEVTVRSKPPPRSASDAEVDRDTIESVPHEAGADVLGTLPGVYVSNRGLLGQAPHLSVRGFEGTSGQDMELFVGSVPMNQISNVRAPGYADLRLVMPEVIRSVRISHGPYDPRQGDFAVAGSAHLDLGLDEPGFLGEGTLGSFGSKRVLLAFAPDDEHWRDSFAAVEAYSTGGPGTGRGGDRASLVGQLAFTDRQINWHGMVAVGTARFDYPGLMALGDFDRGAYPYGAITPLGRDLTSQAHLGNELVWEVQGGALTLGAYVSLTKMQMHEDLTGYALDVMAGLPPTNSDDTEQVNQATTYGLDVAYRHRVKLL
ncbi:MAG: TonB-dependent receptor plug domain-containing protein, partial [Polyangiaceae bacterium]